MKPPKNNERLTRAGQERFAEKALAGAYANQKAVAEHSAALRAAIARLSKNNKSSVTEALKHVSATQQIGGPNATLRAAIYNAAKKAQSPLKAQNLNARWAKASRRHSAFQSKGLASTIQQIAEAQKASGPVPTINRLVELSGSSIPDSSTDAQKQAFRAGLTRGMQEAGSLNLNPWIRQTELFQGSSAADALREDWMQIESDLWNTIEQMAQQLEKLPPQLRVRLAKSLAHYLQSHSGS
jgi:hypothetical protein